jgi:hypothetical protein
MPNLATVIPVMDHIDQTLASQSVNHNYNAPIHAVLSMGKKTLNHYYTLTDSSELYRIAMSMSTLFHAGTIIHYNPPVLHPRHKMSYFHKSSWEPAWIATAHEIIRAEFDHSYPTLPSDNDASAPVEVEMTKVCTDHFLVFLHC